MHKSDGGLDTAEKKLQGTSKQINRHPNSCKEGKKVLKNETSISKERSILKYVSLKSQNKRGKILEENNGQSFPKLDKTCRPRI